MMTFESRFTALTQKEIVPNLPQWEEDGQLPRELHAITAKAGFLGLGFPEEVGGSGGDMVDVTVATEAMLEAGDRIFFGPRSSELGSRARSVLAAGPACLGALTYVLVEQSAALRARHESLETATWNLEAALYYFLSKWRGIDLRRLAGGSRGRGGALGSRGRGHPRLLPRTGERDRGRLTG